LIILAGFIFGCERTGYIVIKTENIKYDDLQQIETLPEGKGFRALVWGSKKDSQKYSNEVNTKFQTHVIDSNF